MLQSWIREVAGWLLVLLGLALFYVCLALLLPLRARILEASALSVIGIVVFRGGIHLLKVAVAARICLRAQAEVARPQRAEKSKQTTTTPWDW